ncbi:MAG: SUMF1/EgtB/PvdO family nonheme iron enzyme [bacterium]
MKIDPVIQKRFLINDKEYFHPQNNQRVSIKDFAGFASSDGLLNMAGNVWEWVDGGEEGLKHVRGGSWKTQGDLYALTWFRLPAQVDILDDDVGFRYVRDVTKESRLSPGSPIADLDQLIQIPGGSYPLGVNPAQVKELTQRFELSQQDVHIISQNSSHTARLSAFRIRKYLVTNEEYYEFVRQTGYADPKNWEPQLEEWTDRPFLLKYKFHPVTHISYEDAEAFCKWRGARLPNNDEWEAAARGVASSFYPWGDEFDSGKGNASETGLGRTSKVNEFPAGASFFGCFDMTGNVMEWVAPLSNGQFCVRGGSFANRGAIQGLSFLWIPADPEITAAEIGFRYVL